MKLRDHRFLKYEAMMAVSAVISSVILCSPIGYAFALCLFVGLMAGHLVGGVFTWKVFVKEKWVGWIKLTIVQTFFTYILNLIVVVPLDPSDNMIEGLGFGLYILEITPLMIIPIAICCKLYREYFHEED